MIKNLKQKCVALGLILALWSCQKQAVKTAKKDNVQLSELEALSVESRVNLSDKLFYYWDGSDNSPITKSVAFVLDKIRDDRGNYLNDEYEVDYVVKDEKDSVLHKDTKWVDFITADSSNIQGMGIIRIAFHQFLKQGQEGYFGVHFEIKDKGKVITRTMGYIFVLKDKSKILMDAYILGLDDDKIRRLIVDVDPKKLKIPDGEHTFYYQMGDFSAYTTYASMIDQRGVITRFLLPESYITDPNLRLHIWYKDPNGETYFTEVVHPKKDFCATRNAQNILNQMFGLSPEFNYNKFEQRIKENHGLQRRERKNHHTEGMMGTKTKFDEVKDYIYFKDYDVVSPVLQKGLQENGKKIGLNGKYISKKLKTLPQEILCFYQEVEEINLNNNLFENSHSRYEDLKFFPKLKVTKLANNNFSSSEKSKVNQVLTGKGLIWEEDKHHEAVYKNEGECWMKFRHLYTCDKFCYANNWMLWNQKWDDGGTFESLPHNNSCPFTYANGYGLPALYKPWDY